MSSRPLPHFSHKPIGKTTHAKGFAYQNVNYITREDACSKVLAGNMPDSREEGARAYFDREANKDGVAANARVADTLIIALPIELTKEQRHEAIAGFMEKIGHGRIAWLAAFHDRDEDAHNPHCHLIFRDADIDTGRKVVGTTTSAKDVREAEEHGWRVPPRMTTKDLRVAWCAHLNAEMDRHGLEARFDERTLKEQGIDRQPQIHVGPKAMSMAEKGKTFDSEDRKRGDHANIYTLLDAGSRAEHNQRIIDTNKNRNAAKPDPYARMTGQEGVEKRALRERHATERRALYKDQAQDRGALRDAHVAQNLEQQSLGRKFYAEARQRAFEEAKASHAEQWKSVWTTKDKKQREEAAAALKVEQKNAYKDAASKQIDKARPLKNEAWNVMKVGQDRERDSLKQRHTEEVAALSRQHIAERNALHERWSEQHRVAQAQKISARLQARQGMTAVQTTAVAMIKSNARDQRQNGAAPNHIEAAQRFAERGRAEKAARATLRSQLNATRQVNQARAGKTGSERGAETATQRQTRGQAQQQSSSVQAATSSRPHKRDERTNAGSGVNDDPVFQDIKPRSRRAGEFPQSVQQQNSGKDRGGGRSGR